MAVLSEVADAANNTSTAYSMTVGDYFFGTLGTASESDWVEVSLVAGQTYTFGLVGVGSLTDNLDDPYLRLRDGSGLEIEFDDDDGPGRNSGLTFTATTSGTYYLDVQSWDNTTAGDYGLSMAEGTQASYDVTMGAGVLLRNDRSWASTSGTGATVTWAIRTSGDDGNGFIAPSAAQIDAIEDVMGYLGGISGLTFNQVNPGGTSNNATILFGAYTANDGAGAYAYYPGTSSDAGDVWMNNNSFSTSSLPLGSFSFFALMHEVGHALGLAHPGDYNAAPGVSITYANNAQFIQDTHQYTVMSYFDESNTTTSLGSYPDTLMLYDILALHQQYGADYSFHSGNTTYGFNATVGGAYDFTTNTTPLLSIWDGAGTDTLDLSGYSMDQLISLIEGSFSDVGGYLANLSIAIGAVIENAIGGSGNDTLIGNDSANSLDGGLGNDTLIGGAGADTLSGGGGTDTVSYADSTGAVGVRLGGGISWGAAAGDTFDSVENLIGSSRNDTLIGSSAANQIDGGLGNDLIYGSGGSDTLIGGGGTDTVTYATSSTPVGVRLGAGISWGGATGDTFVSVENVIGSRRNDTLVGTGEANQIDGWRGNDLIYAGAGDDTVIGGDGDDIMHGQAGNDTFVFAEGFGQDIIIGFSANDAETIDLSAVAGITNFADLISATHLQTDSATGFAMIVDGANTILLDGITVSQIGVGLAYSQDDFVF